MTTKDRQKTNKLTSKSATKDKKTLKPGMSYPSLFLSGYILIILLSQLFTFDRFPEVLMSIGIPQLVAVTLVILLVVLELLTVAYLVRTPKTKKVIIAGKMASVLALLLLSILEIMAIGSGITVIFGATIGVQGGAWSITFLLAIWVLMIWALISTHTPSERKINASHEAGSVKY